jgi:hypothetical protein
MVHIKSAELNHTIPGHQSAKVGRLELEFFETKVGGPINIGTHE